MYRLSLVLSLMTSLGLGGCDTDPSTAAGASLKAATKAEVKPEVKPDPKTVATVANPPPPAKSYELDGEGGQIRFGDGAHGRTPPTAKSEPARYGAGAGKGDETDRPAPGGPVPLPYPNMGHQPSPSGVWLPEVDDEVLVAFQSGGYDERGESAVVSVRGRPLELKDGRYRTRSGKTFTIRKGRFVAD